mgnify:CR=1 FL=1
MEAKILNIQGLSMKSLMYMLIAPCGLLDTRFVHEIDVGMMDK